MKVKESFMIALLCILASNCGSRDEEHSEKGSENQSVNSTMEMSYSEFVNADMARENSQKIKSILGEPDIIRKSGNVESWHYGPDIDATINGDPGAIIGLTISFDSEDRVINVSPSRKSL